MGRIQNTRIQRLDSAMKKDRKRLPGLAFWLLRHILPKQDYVFLNGNFADIYAHRVQSEGRTKAGIWIWG